MQDRGMPGDRYANIVAGSSATKPTPFRGPVLFVTIVALTVGCGGGSGGRQVPQPAPIRLLLAKGALDHPYLPEITQPTEEALDLFTATSGRAVRLEPYTSRDYEHAMLTLLQGEDPPDVAWVQAPLIPMLAAGGHIVDLESEIMEHPGVLAALQPWMVDLYRYDEAIHGIPVGEKGKQCQFGYVMTRAAVARGHGVSAFELITKLREQCPRRGMPDVALSDVRVIPAGDDATEATLVGRVLNIGDDQAWEIHLVAEVAGQQIVLEEVIPRLDPDEEWPFEVTLPALPAAKYEVVVNVNPNQQFQELSAFNNLAKSAWVLDGPPDAPSAIGVPVAIDAIAFQTSVLGMHPRVAWDGTNYLVIWVKQVPLSQSSYGHRIYGARISPAGVVLDAGGFVITTKSAKYDSIGVAYGGGVYLVVWSESVAYATPGSDPEAIVAGARVSTSGTVLDTTPIDIDSSSMTGWMKLSHEYPCAYYDGTNFVVVYRSIANFSSDPADILPENGIFARRVTAAGAALTPKVKLVSMNPNYVTHSLQDLSYAGGKAVLVHQGQVYTPATYDLRRTLIGTSGGLPTSISTTPITSSPVWPPIHIRPGVGSASGSNHLAVWERENTTTTVHDPDLWYSLISGTAGVPSTPQALYAGTGNEFPVVAFDGTNYAVFSQHHHGCKEYIGVQRVSTAGLASAATYWPNADLVFGIDACYGSTNGIVVFADFNIPTTYNGPDASWGIWFQLTDKTP